MNGEITVYGKINRTYAINRYKDKINILGRIKDDRVWFLTDEEKKLAKIDLPELSLFEWEIDEGKNEVYWIDNNTKNIECFYFNKEQALTLVCFESVTKEYEPLFLEENRFSKKVIERVAHISPYLLDQNTRIQIELMTYN